MGRSAGEQIARRRAAVDCIKPKHRSIYITNSNGNSLSFDGCCGSQCLIQGQQYTFVIDNKNSSQTFTITWCSGITNSFTAAAGITTVSFTVPKFNTACTSPLKATIGTLSLDYCKQAFKKPLKQGC
jgi:hypothetical protein